MRGRPIGAAAAVRGAAGADRPAERRRAAGPRPRGHALGRPLDPDLRRLPGAQPAQRAGDAAAQLPDRRAPPPPPAAPAAGRARAPRAGAADRARRRSTATSWPRRSPTSSASAPSEELVERLYARSEGNPLYTEELLAAGLDGRGAAPQSLRDAFMLRIERLSDDAQAAARAIAAGRRARRGDDRRGHRIEPERAAPGAARGASPSRCWSPARTAGFALPPRAAARGAATTTCCPGERSELHLALARALEERVEVARRPRARARRRRSPTTTPPPATSRPRCAPPSRRRWPRARSTPTATPPTWPSARWSCGRGCPTPRGLIAARPRRAAAPGRGRASGGRRPRPRAEALLQRRPERARPGGAIRSPLLAAARRPGAHPVDAQPRAGGRGDRPAGAGAAPGDDEVSPERASLLAWLARTRCSAGATARRCRDGEDALARRARGRRPPLQRPRSSTRSGWPRSRSATSTRVSSVPARGDRDRARGRRPRPHGRRLLEPGRRCSTWRAAPSRRSTWPRRDSTRSPPAAPGPTDWMLLTRVRAWRSRPATGRPRGEHLGPGRHRISLGTAADLPPARARPSSRSATGDEERAGGAWRSSSRWSRRSSEPQWIGAFGTLKAELPAAPAATSTGARAAVADGARPDRAVHRRRDADRPGDGGRAARRGRHRPARARPARARGRARRPGPRADPHAAPARGGGGGRPGGERLARGRAPPSWPGPEAATTPSCGWRRRGSGSACRGPSSARWRCGARPRRRSTPVTAPPAPRPLRRRSRSRARLGARWLVDELTALAQRARLDLGEAVERAARRRIKRRRRERGPVRAHRARASGAGAARRGRDQPSDRGGAVHGREDGQRARLADPQQAWRA